VTRSKRAPIIAGASVWRTRSTSGSSGTHHYRHIAASNPIPGRAA
jgi:hypothetical protein